MRSCFPPPPPSLFPLLLERGFKGLTVAHQFEPRSCSARHGGLFEGYATTVSFKTQAPDSTRLPWACSLRRPSRFHRACGVLLSFFFRCLLGEGGWSPHSFTAFFVHICAAAMCLVHGEPSLLLDQFLTVRPPSSLFFFMLV
eukprot:RCo017797